jgi:cytochrome c
VSWKKGRAIIGLVCLVLAGIAFGLIQDRRSTARARAATSQEAEEKEGQALADAHLAQWKRANPDRVADWIAEEKERHTIQPPADNSDLLKGQQGEGHSYGQYTEIDLLTWERETEKLVVEGSRIFHDAAALGGTVGVSCDMCHPHAANTHPETYPKFQTQMGRVALLRDMINWCIEQPVRGQRMDPDDARMRALEAYIYAQRKGKELNYGKH